MTLDPQTALHLAFRHLDGFSVPGIGTFTRSRVGAQIDHQKKRIQPPQERFVLESGEGKLAAFEDFLFRWYNIKMDEATAFAAGIGIYLQDGLQAKGQVRIEGMGTLRKDESGQVGFVAEDGIFGQSNDFFGLQAVDYTVGENVKPTVEKKKEAAKASVLANTTVVEPTKPRRRFPIGWLLFLIVLLIGAGAAWNWQVELKGLLTEWGILGKDGGNNTAARDKAVADSLARVAAVNDSLAAIEAHRQDSLDSIADAGKPKKPKPKPAPKPKPVAAKPKPAPKPKPIADPSSDMAMNDGRYGVRPQSGHYYLVISSNEIPEEAVETANAIPGAKVLVPYYQKGYYKVSVFESTSKSQVIAKMVSLKDKYPKSWIFWSGMPIRDKE